MHNSDKIAETYISYRLFNLDRHTLREALSKIKLSATGLELTLGSEEVYSPEFIYNRHMKVVSSPAPNAGRF